MGDSGQGNLKNLDSKACPISSGLEDPSMGGIQGERLPFLHLAMSQMDVVGSMISSSSHSHLAC